MDEFYAELKAGWRKRRDKRLDAADPTGWTQHTPHHWSREFLGRRLDYWPGTRRWRFDGQTHTGKIQDWMKKHDVHR